MITAAGLDTLDEVGLDNLTMRAVAKRLGVHVGGLYYHVSDKSGLLALMADRLCAEIEEQVEARGSWREQAVGICVAVRRTLLAHRDGARIFASGPLVASVNALGLMEQLLASLAEGVAPARVGTAGDTLFSYVTGYVLQEQHGPPVGFDARSLAELQRRFPLVFRADGRAANSDDTFRTSLEAVIAGFASDDS